MSRASFLLLFGLLLPGSAAAHPLAPSLLEIREFASGQARVLWKTPARRVPGSQLMTHLPAHSVTGETHAPARVASARIERWSIACGEQGLVGYAIEVRGIVASRTNVLLRIRLADGRTFRRVLRAARPAFVVPARERRLDVLRDYVVLGTGHILTGWDHLLFVLGLLLLVGPGRQLVWTITAFTTGHSITLCLAALGFVRVAAAPIEVGIALTILLLAGELARPPGPSWMRRFPWGMAALFGLLHGLGFAGALNDIGLPGAEIPLALFAFNVGVELGQLAFIFAALVACVPARRRGIRTPDWALRAPAYAIGSLAAYWLIERVAQIL